MTKKLYSFRFRTELIDVVDKTSKKQFKDRTQFIEEAIREKLNSLNMKIENKEQRKIVYYDNIEDIPLD
jgi:metal-responsive CopG/Arc/MetJ family transcriptional regulator